MALTLPPKFQQDIQGTNTNLIPIVIVDPDGLNLRVSTTSLTFDGEHYKPLLMSLPKLSESIDIVKRKYKISSINISISNYEYNGERLSETIVDTAFVNKDASVYWITESAETMDDAFLVYKGITRKYKHDEKKVDFAIEDQTQKLLHKDLPSTTVQTEKGYKYIPLVYGKRKASPITLDMQNKLHLDTNPNVNLQLNLDNNSKDAMFDLPESSVKVFEEGYVKILHKIEHLMDYTDNPYSQLKGGDSMATKSDLEVGVEQLENFNNQNNVIQIKKTRLVDNNIIQGIAYGKPNVDFIFQSRSPNIKSRIVSHGGTQFSGAQQQETLIVDGKEVLTDGDYTTTFKETFVIHSYIDNQVLGDNEFAHVAMSLGCEPQGSFKQTYLIGIAINGRWMQRAESYEPFRCGISPTGHAAGFFAATNVYDFISSRPFESHEATTAIYNNLDYWYDDVFGYPSGWKQGNQGTYRSTRVYKAPNMTQGEYWYLYDDGSMLGSLEWNGVSVNAGNEDSIIWYKPPINYHSGSYGGGSTDHFRNNALCQIWQHAVGFSPFSGTATNNIWIVNWVLGDEITSLPQYEDNASYGYANPFTSEITFNMKQIDFASFVDVELSKTKWFADVNGRLSTSGVSNPTAPAIITDLLTNELNFNGSYIEPIDNYNFTYAFGFSKKMNSKKLIESLSSASPFIPRFSPNGDFKFSVIPLNNEQASVNHTIKDIDIIDFKYSRTPIESVYERVEFFYNFDYGFESFQSKVDITIPEITPLSGWNKDYYGFDPNITNTLIIDDDRGKYITDYDTASRFATWLLSLNCNQHLLMDITVSLSVGLKVEVGDIVSFDKLIGNINPYMIGSANNYSGIVNGQEVYNKFIVTKTNKTLDKVSISLYQLHNLFLNATDIPEIGGCTDENSCNYDPNATYNNGSCFNGYLCDDGSYECNQGDCPEVDYDCFGTPNGTAVPDCMGVCGGDAQLECGVCWGGTSEYGNPRLESCDGTLVCPDDVEQPTCDNPSAMNYDDVQENGCPEETEGCDCCEFLEYGCDPSCGNLWAGTMFEIFYGLNMTMLQLPNQNDPDFYSNRHEMWLQIEELLMWIDEGEFEQVQQVTNIYIRPDYRPLSCGGTEETDYNYWNDTNSEGGWWGSYGSPTEISIGNAIDFLQEFYHNRTGNYLDLTLRGYDANCPSYQPLAESDPPYAIPFKQIFQAGGPPNEYGTHPNTFEAVYDRDNDSFSCNVIININEDMEEIEDGRLVYYFDFNKMSTLMKIPKDEYGVALSDYHLPSFITVWRDAFYTPNIGALYVSNNENLNPATSHQFNHIYPDHWFSAQNGDYEIISTGTGEQMIRLNWNTQANAKFPAIVLDPEYIPVPYDWMITLKIRYQFSPSAGNFSWGIYNIPTPIHFTDCVLGDMNQDGGWNVLDIVELSNLILDAAVVTNAELCAGDMNGDGGLNVLDVILLVDCILNGTCENLGTEE